MDIKEAVEIVKDIQNAVSKVGGIGLIMQRTQALQTLIDYCSEPKQGKEVKCCTTTGEHWWRDDKCVICEIKRPHEVSQDNEVSLCNSCLEVCKATHPRRICPLWNTKQPNKKVVKFVIQSMDARAWANEFNRLLVAKNEQPYDVAWLTSWFANAIMAGYDEAKRRTDPTKEVSEPKVAVEENNLSKTSKYMRGKTSGKTATESHFKLSVPSVEEIENIIYSKIGLESQKSKTFIEPLMKTYIKDIAQSIYSHFKLSVPNKLEMHKAIADIGLDQDCAETDRIVDAIYKLLLERRP